MKKFIANNIIILYGTITVDTQCLLSNSPELSFYSSKYN